MRSIRLSLTLYFLALLTAALGTVSVLVYRNFAQALDTKEETDRDLLMAQYKEGERAALDRFREEEQQVRDRLDKDLLQQARTLAQRALPQRDNARIGQFSRDWEKWTAPNQRATHQAVQLLGLGMLPGPSTPGRVAFWASEASKRTFPYTLYWAAMITIRPAIRLQNDDPLPPIHDQVNEYCQIDSALGTSFRSETLRTRGLQFPVQSEWLDSSTSTYFLDWDDVRLAPEVQVRRVIMVVPFARLGRLGAPWPNPFLGSSGRDGRDGFKRGGQSGSPPSVPTAPRAESTSRPTLLIHYASDTSRRDAVIAQLAMRRDQEVFRLAEQRTQKIDRLAEDKEASLQELRYQLLLIAGSSFAAMLVGVLAVIYLGLAPLSRVSDAVSRVSEKDFRLQLEVRGLPRELKPIVERLSTTLEQLERAFAREKQATADISHELRTPLAALMTTIEVTLRKPRSAEEYREALADCRASADQINQAVERLLALARLDAGVDRLRSQTVNAADLARQCVSVLKPLASAQGISMSLEANEPIVLQTDPDKLREILNNLLHNAIQYNRPNGSINVAVHRENGALALQVRDTGIGIPPDARPHIFERFYRADASRQSDGLHAGLGLAIVKGYLDLMGGTIAVDSTEGEGSTFSIRLPA